ncbi:serine peptidase [Devosia pacifica]|uniref:Probable periplasmic serine endoprotease DegP-like n=1 Tax=Devosia pacifica TaxID=1335967 RepID=A0A918S8G2_9HYPH|nr:Do family serine endopeptidase [Devosia pacifica]GHA29171.1 serine peptidase [Devosia pacifica]
MRPTILSRTRRFLGASAIALMVGVGGVSTALVATNQPANAQMQNAAEIQVPETTPLGGFADLVEAVKPAVVSIRVEGEQTRGMGPGGRRGGGQFEFNFPDLPQDHPFRDFFDQFGDQFGGPGNGGAPEPRPFMAAGSGFMISADGYIVTNNHVVQDASTVTVMLDDGSEREAEVVGTDERTDLAVIKIDGEDLPFVTFEDERSRVGDWVVAVGNPFGLGGTVTVGIISASGRDIGGSSYGDFLQIDAAVNTGNSGGPAFNLNGEVVGVNTAIYSPNGGNVGIAFAIPSSTVQMIVDQLISDGEVTRGYLGVSIQDVTGDIADSVGLDSARGAIVREPSPETPAAQAGIQSGDIVLEVDGERIDDALDLSRTIASKAPNTEVDLTLWRDGEETTVTVTLATLEEQVAETEEQPQPPQEVPETEETSVAGLTLVPNGDGSGGLLVREVESGSAAADRGISVGDVILEVDNNEVSSVSEFEDAISEVRERGLNTALVMISRDDVSRFIGLPINEEE